MTPEQEADIRARVEGVPAEGWTTEVAETVFEECGAEIHYHAGTGPPRESEEAGARDMLLIEHAPAHFRLLLAEIDLLRRFLGEAHDESSMYRQGYMDGQRAMRARAAEEVRDVEGGFLHVDEDILALDPTPFDASQVSESDT